MNYCWEIAVILNRWYLTTEELERGTARFGESYWDEQYMASESSMRTLVQLCLALAVNGVPSFRAFHRELRGTDLAEFLIFLGTTMRVEATGLLGDLWRRMLYDFSKRRALGTSWYEV